MISGEKEQVSIFSRLVARSTCGGGGGVRAVPVGVIEISEQRTCFVPVTDRKKLAGAVVAGIGLGILLSWRSRRR